jgi:hypothetical protein
LETPGVRIDEAPDGSPDFDVLVVDPVELLPG